MKNLIVVAMLLVFTGMITGCTSISRTAPASPLIVQAGLKRADYSVLKRVEGQSCTKSYFGGLFEEIDGKTVLFGIIFDEKYAGIPGTPLSSPLAGVFPFNILIRPSTAARAYYQALIQAPDADMILPKSCIHKRSGFPLFYSEETVIYTGKAIKIKSDSELK